jgi:hypothetical protein
MDHYQILAFKLCFTYYNWTVSYQFVSVLQIWWFSWSEKLSLYQIKIPLFWSCDHFPQINVCEVRKLSFEQWLKKMNVLSCWGRFVFQKFFSNPIFWYLKNAISFIENFWHPSEQLNCRTLKNSEGSSFHDAENAFAEISFQCIFDFKGELFHMTSSRLTKSFLKRLKNLSKSSFHFFFFFFFGFSKFFQVNLRNWN